MQDNNHIKWTNEEWQLVAKRASAFKAGKPDLAWTSIVVVCQDDIAVDRRRVYFNKMSALKPLFDILHLDEQGNVPPPPPPPPPPEPVLAPALPAPVMSVVEPAGITALAKVPVADLINEVFVRGATLKADLDVLLTLEAKITKRQAEHEALMDTLAKRLDGVEAYVMTVMETMDRITLDHGALSLLAKTLSGHMSELGVSNKKVIETALATKVSNDYAYIAPIRFLLFGLQDKDLIHVQSKIQCKVKLELIKGDNQEHAPLPANIHYCLVSGHSDFNKRFLACRQKYGDKVERLPNGAISTFAHAIEGLALGHKHPKPMFPNVNETKSPSAQTH